ncbi:MAG: hypothetical protein IKL07_02845 [Clostridium sp.]|nr:hypothetical protein [Clostridium sp.]
MENMNNTEYVLNIIRAALPYVNSRTRNGMEAAIKTGELAETIQMRRKEPELEAYELGNDTVDMEGLLLSVQNVCIGPERELVNTILNFYKTRSLYQSYQEFRRNNMQSELQAASLNNNSGKSAPNNTMLEFLMSQLSPEQKSTFEAMSMMINSGTFGNMPNQGTQKTQRENKSHR